MWASQSEAERERKVQDFTSIAGAEIFVANQFLERYNGDLDKALNDFFEFGGVLPPESQLQQMSWDETLFNSERDFVGPQPRPPDFQIHAPDQTMQQRPNSRTDNWVSDSTQHIEDAELNNAIKASLQSSQETGVVPIQSFHQVDDEFQTSNAALVRVAQDGRRGSNLSIHPAPEQRKRLQEEPVFVAPGLSETSLAAILTVLHEIPLAREALLNRDLEVAETYEFNQDWWLGSPCRPVARDELSDNSPDRDIELQDIEDGPVDPRGLLAEVQRLMTALDCSKRAYVSVNALEDHPDVKSKDDRQQIAHFMESWTTAAVQCGVPTDLSFFMTSQVNVLYNGEITGTAKFVHDLELDGADDFDTFETLAEDSIGKSSKEGQGIDVHLSDVLVFQVHPPRQSGSSVGIKIPGHINSSSWLGEENFKRLNDHQASLNTTRDRISSIERARERLLWMLSSETSGQKVDSLQLLDQAIRYLELEPVRPLNISKSNERIEQDSTTLGGLGSTKLSDTQEPHHSIQVRKDLAQRLKRQKMAIEAKLEALGQEKEHAQNQLQAQRRQRAQDAAGAIQSVPDCEYTLRGVAAEQSIFVQAEVTNEEDLLVVQDPSYQWWRMIFRHGNPNRVTYSRVKEIEVRKASKDSKSSITLVYANSPAMAYERKQAPPVPVEFIEQDNQAFERELDGSDRGPIALPRSEASSGETKTLDTAHLSRNIKAKEEDILEESTSDHFWHKSARSKDETGKYSTFRGQREHSSGTSYMDEHPSVLYPDLVLPIRGPTVPVKWISTSFRRRFDNPLGFSKADDTEGFIVASHPTYDATSDVNWGDWKAGQAPQLPPRQQTIAGPDSLASKGRDSNIAPTNNSKRMTSAFSKIKNTLSRSKSRERAIGPVDLLTDNSEQKRGAAVMTPDDLNKWEWQWENGQFTRDRDQRSSLFPLDTGTPNRPARYFQMK